ncbi:MAG TPA: competence/damage-inducible protein A [Candidatus Brocadiia bacterium]|nr:competence/damage-inducible protein A [Candidatus Brocadiia bacterium]
MNAEIVSTGTEVVSGRIADTNAAWLSARLEEMGIPVRFHQAAGDRVEDIRSALTTAIGRSDLIIVTGGLGPTADDLTRYAVADCGGCDLELDEPSLERIRQMYFQRSIAMPPSNSRQAMFPKGCRIVRNDVGTAPGFAMEIGPARIIVMPGVPSEMKYMWTNVVAPMISGFFKLEKARRKRFINVYGVPESAVGQVVEKHMQRDSNPEAGVTVDWGAVTISLCATAEDDSSAEAMLDKVEAEVRAALGDSVISNDGRDLPQALVGMMKEEGFTLALAESCTGGMAASLIVSVPGASDVLLACYVTYSNEAKVRTLGVPEDLLKQHGAVSEPVALAMASGARAASGADVGVGITGIAGPDGGTEQKPVGLVFAAVDIRGDCRCKELHMRGDRDTIRGRSAKTALDILRRRLLELGERTCGCRR